MNDFFTWDVLATYTTFVATVFMLVEFTKEMKMIKKVPTKYWSFLVSSFLLIITNLATGNFELKNVILYLLSSVSISLGSNGLSNFNKKEGEK